MMPMSDADQIKQKISQRRAYANIILMGMAKIICMSRSRTLIMIIIGNLRKS